MQTGVEPIPGDGAHPARHSRLIEHFRQRLEAGISRSPLLRVSISKTGRMLDLSRLRLLQAELPEDLLSAIIAGRKGGVPIQLRLLQDTQTDADTDDDGEPALSREVRECRALYDLLVRRISRRAELVRRERGIHPVWLGYPLLYVPAMVDGQTQFILSPVFLWPADVQADSHKEGRVIVRRYSPSKGEAGDPMFNMAMRA